MRYSRFMLLVPALLGTLAATTRSDLPHHLLYVSYCCNTTAVLVYDANGHRQAPIEQITSGLSAAGGLAVDKAGNLYVADNGNIVVYAPGAVQPFRTITDGDAYFVAVGNDGTVYSGHICSACPQKISVFPASGPSYQINEPSVEQVTGLALDAKGNLYADYTIGYLAHTEFIRYAPGSHGPGTNLGIIEDGGGGFAFDRDGNLVVATGRPSIDVFPPGATQPSFQFARWGDPLDVAFNAAKTRLYVLQRSFNRVNVFDYPSGRLIDGTRQFFTGRVTGLALGPS